MIGYLRGVVTHLFIDHCFMDVHGVGYRVFIAESTRKQVTVGTEMTVFTYLNVREDALLLYGFLTQDEYQLFLQLTSVSGIGPKGAMSILSASSPDVFRAAVSNKNITTLTKLPGVGKKTAERIILELYDKIGVISEQTDSNQPSVHDTVFADDINTQALQALMALGYSQGEIAPVLRKFSDVHSVEQLIKQVLREFGRR